MISKVFSLAICSLSSIHSLPKIAFSTNQGAQPAGSDKYQAAPSQDNLSHGSDMHSGQATYYDLWESPSAYVSCGFVQKDPYLVALRPEYMKASCGKCILVESPDTNVKVKVRVVDTCPSCTGKGDIDLSLQVLKQLKPTAQTEGHIKVNWSFVDCGSGGGSSDSSSSQTTSSTPTGASSPNSVTGPTSSPSSASGSSTDAAAAPDNNTAGSPSSNSGSGTLDPVPKTGSGSETAPISSGSAPNPAPDNQASPASDPSAAQPEVGKPRRKGHHRGSKCKTCQTTV